MSLVETKVAGYLEQRWKKYILSVWRRWFCVLNGQLLLFYRSEDDYMRLGKFHECFDMSLVGEVQPAPDETYGIVLTTQAGATHFLRADNEVAHRMWLESMQATIVLHRQTVLLDEQIEETAERKAKSVLGEANVPLPGLQRLEIKHVRKQEVFRFSLDHIPGQKKRSAQQQHNNAIKTHKSDDATLYNREAISVGLPPPAQRCRPLSQSVSSFMVLDANDESNRNDKRAEGIPTDTDPIIRDKKKFGGSPRLPTSMAVGKILSHLQYQIGSRSEASLQAAGTKAIIKSQKAASVADVVCVEVANGQPSEQRQEETASTGKDVTAANPEIEKQASPSPPTASSASCRKKSKRDKKLKTDKSNPRRRSGLDLLKQFFTPAKMFHKKVKFDDDPTAVSEVKPVDATPVSSREGSQVRDGADFHADAEIDAKQESQRQGYAPQPPREEVAGNEPDVCTNRQEYLPQISGSTHSLAGDNPSDHFDEKAQRGPNVDRSTQSSATNRGSVEEEPFVAVRAFETDVRVLEIIEPAELEPNKSKSSDPREFDTFVDDFVHVCWDSRAGDTGASTPPPIPVKTKVKCPSPTYDVPRSSAYVKSDGESVPIGPKIDIDSVDGGSGVETRVPDEDHFGSDEQDSLAKKPPSANLEIPLEDWKSRTTELDRLSFASSEEELVAEEAIKELQDEDD